MKAIQLPAYNKNVLRSLLSLKPIEKDIPRPAKNEVLVKLHAAPCNPSDIAFLQGGYNIIKSLPCVPGFEGSGIVVETGEGANDLIDKKVSCFIQTDNDGTWAEYFIVNKNDLLVLDDAMDLNQAACFMVNPFTAYALVEIAILRESKAIIQNAAGGQVAGFIRRLAEKHKIEVINVVRKKETADDLIADGHAHVLIESDENFVEDLQQLAHKLIATTAFDAVGGKLSGFMFNAMPVDSELVVYGGLSNKPMNGIDTIDIIFKNKIISGFNLVDWKDEMDKLDFEAVSGLLQEMFITRILKTAVQSEIQMDQIVRGMKSYLGNMSGGKVLIKP